MFLKNFNLVWLGLFCAVITVHANAVGNDIPISVEIPAGNFIVGSDLAERELAYQLDELAYGEPITRKQGWYEGELPRQSVQSEAFCIGVAPITNQQYALFIAATKHVSPNVDRETWASYKLIHPFPSTQRFSWDSVKPPQHREDHPVVLVSIKDAQDYALWLSQRTGKQWRLPSEQEWEIAMRGSDGRIFPWGRQFDPTKLNSADSGSFDTTPVGQYTSGMSPFGVLDGAGQVFEWTSTAHSSGRSIVKGGSWDDKGCGVCRPAARHGRPNEMKHILIGFRLVRDIAKDHNQSYCEYPE